MKVLVTGIAGFIGYHAACRLAAEGCAVIGIDSFNAYYPPRLKRARAARLPAGVRCLELDITDHQALGRLVRDERPTVVLHLAAQAGVRYSIDNPFAYAQSNLVGHLSVLEACRHATGLSHLVYASSSSVYGGSRRVPFREDDPANRPVSLYAATKLADEAMSACYAHLYGLRQIGLRFFTVYGDWGRPDMAYWLFTDRILRGMPIRVFNDGRMARDFTHVDDVVDGIWSVVAGDPGTVGDGASHRVYNIGNSRPMRLLRMIAVLEGAIGKSAIQSLEPMQPGDVPETHADIAALARDYGFAPRTPIEDGLPRFVTWFKEHGHLGAEEPAVAS